MKFRNKTILDINNDLKNNKYTIEELIDDILLELEKESKSNAINFIDKKNTKLLAKKLDDKDLKKELNNNLLYGIPFFAKDNISTKDTLTTSSSKILSNYIPVYNATIIDDLKKKNTILMGKTALDELGMGGTGLYSCFGIIKNPLNENHIVGGSSSGSAYVVTKGIVPFAIGTDTGDSIRKPASYNGIVGFKPTYGSISRYGLLPYASSLDTIGFFTRNVTDMSIICDETFRYDNKDFTSIDNKDSYYKNINNFDSKKYKFGYIKEVYDYLDDYHKKEYDKLFIKMKKDNIVVEELNFRKDLLEVINLIYIIISFSESCSNNSNLDGIKFGIRENDENYIDLIKNTRTKNFGNIVKKRFLIGMLSSKKENQKELLLKSKKIRRLIINEIDKLFKKVDILLIPPSKSIAPLINENHEIDDVNENDQIKNLILDDILILFNFNGSPSITIPFFEHNNMPIGINLSCKCKNDLLTLQAAKFLENYNKN